MPQIQVLPAVPTFGNRLAQVLGEATGNIGQGLAQRRSREAISGLTNELLDESKTPLEKLGIATKLVSRIGPEGAKAILPLFAPFIYGQGQQAGPSPIMPQAQGMPIAGTPPEIPKQAGVPQGPVEPITAATQPTEVTAQPAPTGMTVSSQEARKNEVYKQFGLPSPAELEQKKAHLLSQVGLPYGIGDRAQESLKALRENEKLAQKEISTLEAEERAVSRKENENIAKFFREDIEPSYLSAQTSKANLDRMEQLKDDPNLLAPFQATVAEAIGIPLGILNSPESEEFNKLVAQRGLNVASAYGFGRILQTEFQNFLRSIPNILNSKEGKERIINTLRYFDNLALKRYDEYVKLRKESKKGITEEEFRRDLNEKMKPFVEKAGDVLKYGDELFEVVNPKTKEKGRVRKRDIPEAMNNGFEVVK